MNQAIILSLKSFRLKPFMSRYKKLCWKHKTFCFGCNFKVKHFILFHSNDIFVAEKNLSFTINNAFHKGNSSLYFINCQLIYVLINCCLLISDAVIEHVYPIYEISTCDVLYYCFLMLQLDEYLKK